MSRYLSSRKIQVDDADKPTYDDETSPETLDSKLLKDPEPFLGVKVRRRASLIRDYRGDYLDVPSRPKLLKILEKQVSSVMQLLIKLGKFSLRKLKVE